MTDTPAPFVVSTSTAAQCQDRLAALEGNPDWGKALLKNDAFVLSEFKSLAAKIAAGSAPDDSHLLALDKPPANDATYGNELFTADKLAFVSGMRDAGLSEAELAEALNGNRKYSAEQIAFAKNLLAERMGDQDWCRRLSSKDVAASRELKRLSVILSTAA
jgi:hypothetical protein